MNIFIAGGTGAIGRPLLPKLIAAGHRVVALTRSAERADALAQAGAEPVIGDVFDADGLKEHVVDARPDVVIHQLTAFGATDADPLAETIRIRIEGTRNLVAAAKAANAKRFIAQSISFVYKPVDGLANEETPLYFDGPAGMQPLVKAVHSLEQQTLDAAPMSGLVLRYGWFYGPGTNYDPSDTIPRAIRNGRVKLVGGGHGTYSFIHVQDAAEATMKALESNAAGIYNIVDDDPAPLHTWLPEAARMLNGPTPEPADESAARKSLGDLMVYIFNEQPGVSNTKAKRDLGWSPSIPTWRAGFRKEFAATK